MYLLLVRIFVRPELGKLPKDCDRSMNLFCSLCASISVAGARNVHNKSVFAVFGHIIIVIYYSGTRKYFTPELLLSI